METRDVNIPGYKCGQHRNSWILNFKKVSTYKYDIRISLRLGLVESWGQQSCWNRCYTEFTLHLSSSVLDPTITQYPTPNKYHNTWDQIRISILLQSPPQLRIRETKLTDVDHPPYQQHDGNENEIHFRLTSGDKIYWISCNRLNV
jgi:hypothetical protein